MIKFLKGLLFKKQSTVIVLSFVPEMSEQQYHIANRNRLVNGIH